MTSGITGSLSAIGAAAVIAFLHPLAARAQENDAISACVSKDGRIRMVVPPTPRDSDHLRRQSTCRRDERKVTWNIAGPQGPPGPRGEPGVPGVRGGDGPPGPGFSGVQYYTVGNGDLRPVGGGLFGTSFAPPPGGTFSTAAAPLLAGIHLPQRAQVLQIRAHVFDNSSSDATIELIEQTLADGTATIVSSLASAGAAAAPYSVDAMPAASHVVDNATFHYFIRVLPSPVWTATTLQVLGVTIAYTLEGGPES